jgi:Cu/Ag efflux pump CusA
MILWLFRWDLSSVVADLQVAVAQRSLPFALTGGIWFLYLKGYRLSVATTVGFIAPAVVARLAPQA